MTVMSSLVFSTVTVPGVLSIEAIFAPSRLSEQLAPGGVVAIAISCFEPSTIEEHPAKTDAPRTANHIPFIDRLPLMCPYITRSPDPPAQNPPTETIS